MACCAPDNAGRGSGVRALVLRKGDLQRLKAEVAAGGGRTPEEQAEEQRWAEHVRRLREGSSLMARSMGLVEQQEHERLTAKKEGREAAARAERERRAAEAAAERCERRKEVLQKAKAMIVAANNPGRRALDSALLFAETLRERQAQVAFGEQLKAAERACEAAWLERLRAEWRRMDDVAQGAGGLALERRRRYKEALLKQMEDDAAVRADTKCRMLEERAVLEAMNKELDGAEDGVKMAAQARRAWWRAAQAEALGAWRAEQQKRHREGLEEDRVVAAIREMHRAIDTKRKANDKQRLEQSMQARRRMGSSIWEAHAAGLSKLAEEDCRRRRVQEEEELRWAERERVEAEQRACVVAFRQHGHQEFLELQGRRRAQALKDAQLAQELRRRMEAEYAQMEERDQQEHRRKQAEARDNYCKQMEEKKEQQRQEAETEQRFLDVAQRLWAEGDGQFFAYADDLLRDAGAKGRPLLPFHRAIQAYKKKHNLLPRTTRTNTVKTPEQNEPC